MNQITKQMEVTITIHEKDPKQCSTTCWYKAGNTCSLFCCDLARYPVNSKRFWRPVYCTEVFGYIPN